MKKQVWLILFAIFFIMYLLNSMKPLSSDDYFSFFVWPEGLPINGELPVDVHRVNDISDILKSIKTYYLTWGGRVPGGLPVGVFIALIGKEYFNPVNAFMMVLLVMEIYWLSHEGIITFKFKPSYLIWIAFSLWAFNICFNDTCLWLSGSCNYLWMAVVVLAFLIPYVREYYNNINEAFYKDNWKIVICMFFGGLLAGWSHETTTCWLILILFYYLFFYNKKKLQFWKTAGFIGFCIGYALLIFAPGNFSRLQMQQQTSSIIIASELIYPKLIELAMILLFHSFLWYFIIRFFFIFQETDDYPDKFYLDLNLVKVCNLIAVGSAVLMLCIPSRGLRPSFLGLIYLTISAALLFRMQENVGLNLLTNNAKVFLKLIGYSYMVLTISVSLWCNYRTHCEWNAILVKVAAADNNHVLEYKADNIFEYNHFLNLLSGFHLIEIPISEDENNEINKVFSRYYKIRGIRVTRNGSESLDIK